MPSNHLILCCPLLLLPSIFPSIRVFSNELPLYNRWSKYWSFSFSISPSNDYSGLISFRMDWLDLLAVQETLKSLSNTTAQKHLPTSQIPTGTPTTYRYKENRPGAQETAVNKGSPTDDSLYHYWCVSRRNHFHIRRLTGKLLNSGRVDSRVLRS